MLQIAIRVGKTGEVSELLSRILASTKNAESLLQISEELQQGGLTRYAAAAAKKATILSRGKHSTSFLRKLSQQLEELGKGHEVAGLAKTPKALDQPTYTQRAGFEPMELPAPSKYSRLAHRSGTRSATPCHD